MVPASLRRSLRTKTKNEVLRSIGPAFTLNRGHVTFFYDKMLYLGGLHRKWSVEGLL